MNNTDRRTPWSWLDDAYPYALDALDPDQQATIDDWLHTTDPDRAREFHALVARIHDTLARITVVDTTPPPPHLENRILQALDHHPQPHPLTATKTKRGKPWQHRWLTIAAAAIVAIGTATGITILVNQPTTTPGITAQQILDRPDHRQATIDATGGGEMTIDTSTALGAAAITLDNMPALPSDRTYQLWLVPAAGAPQSVTTLTTGTAITTVTPTDTIAVTIEPAGGSPAPTTPIIASTTIS